MADSSKTLRHMLLGEIDRAIVTHADLGAAGAISVDRDLVDAAGFLENEKVDVYDVTNGARLSTWVIPAPRGSGEIGINGPAAHLVRPGDLVVIASYGWMKEKQALKHQPKVVLMDDQNRGIVKAKEENPPQDPLGRSAEKREKKKKPGKTKAA